MTRLGHPAEPCSNATTSRFETRFRGGSSSTSPSSWCAPGFDPGLDVEPPVLLDARDGARSVRLRRDRTGRYARVDRTRPRTDRPRLLASLLVSAIASGVIDTADGGFQFTTDSTRPSHRPIGLHHGDTDPRSSSSPRWYVCNVASDSSPGPARQNCWPVYPQLGSVFPFPAEKYGDQVIVVLDTRDRSTRHVSRPACRRCGAYHRPRKVAANAAVVLVE